MKNSTTSKCKTFVHQVIKKSETTSLWLGKNISKHISSKIFVSRIYIYKDLYSQWGKTNNPTFWYSEVDGAIPSFMAIATVIMVDDAVLNIFVMAHCPEVIRLRVKASINSMDAVAWIRKYFVAASKAKDMNRHLSGKKIQAASKHQKDVIFLHLSCNQKN